MKKVIQIEDYIVQIDCSIIKTMKHINENNRSIAFVCNGHRLLASVTDGDIRRFLLKNTDLEKPISEVAQFHPFYLHENQREEAVKFMQENCIMALPIVDNKMNIIDIKFLLYQNNIFKNTIDAPLVIMAGGKGMRLKPYTDILPKPLIPIDNMTIIEHIMDRFSQYGCQNIYMIVNYKKNLIKAYFADNDTVHRNITFIDEDDYYGTGGGLKLLKGKINETFFMTNCDILIDANYEEIYNTHKVKGNLLTIVCAKKEVVIPYGTIEISEQGQLTGLKEKPCFHFNTNTGLYIIEPDFLDIIPDHTFIHITDIIQECIKAGEKVGTYLISEKNWLDMGQLEELYRMKAKINFL